MLACAAWNGSIGRSYVVKAIEDMPEDQIAQKKQSPEHSREWKHRHGTVF